MPQSPPNALAAVPPDWVALTEVFPCVHQYLGVDIRPKIVDLISDLRRGQLRYHIAELNADALRSRAYGTFARIPGLTHSTESSDVVVCDWDSVEVDWLAGTVGGSRLASDRSRQRHRIEIWWLDLERWVTTRARRVSPVSEHVANVWSGAVGAWVPLAELPATVERALGIPAAEAARALRDPLERYRIQNRVVDWHDWRETHRGNLVANRNPLDSHPHRVSDDGWPHVNWISGTLAGHRIEVRWVEVRQHLANLFASSKRTIAATTRHGADPQGADKFSDTELWMRAYVRGWNDAGKKPKREETLKLCQRDMKTTYRRAKAAWEAVPSELKNPPRTK